jgi:hypothetical protein
MLKTLFTLGRLSLSAVLAQHRISLEHGRDRTSLNPRPWWRGFLTLRWRGGYGHESPDGRRKHALRVWWNILETDLRLGFHRNHGEDEVPVHAELCLPPFGMSVSYEGDVPRWWPRQYADGRSFEVRFSPRSWLAYWNLWQHPDIHNANDPRWRCRSIDVREAVLGSERVHVAKRETRDLGISLPSGIVAPCRATLIYEHIDRPRWPFKRLRQRCEVKCSEAAYKFGFTDQAFWLRGNGDWPEAIGQIVESITDTRLGLAAFTWKPTLKHCRVCKGIGLAPKCCTGCNGSGLRPLEEAMQQAIIEASREAPAGDKMAADLIAQSGGRVARELVEYALEVRQHAGGSMKAGTALLAAALCLLRLGHLSEAAEASALAFARAVDMQQVNAAQRLLSFISRLPLPAVPLWSGLNAPILNILTQLSAEGILQAIALWEVDNFAQVMGIQEDGAQSLIGSWREIQAYLDALHEHASLAGWIPGEPLARFVERLRGERNTATDTLADSLKLLEDALSFSIPEGPFGEPVRQFCARAGAFLQQQGRLSSVAAPTAPAPVS